MRGDGEPITSNLPSENIAMGIRWKRIAGTGRTTGILLKKQQKQGIVAADGVAGAGGGGAGGHGGGGGGGRRWNDEIAFELERGGGARANLLATKGRQRSKLVDAAAMKVGVDIGLVARALMAERERQKRKMEEKRKEEKEGAGGGGKKKAKDNFGVSSASCVGGTDLSRDEREKRRLDYLGGGGESSDEDEERRRREEFSYYVLDETDELRNLPEDDRRAALAAEEAPGHRLPG
ncbi:hypothetical protein ACHAWF_002171 [Thalassiosira exigua]